MVLRMTVGLVAGIITVTVIRLRNDPDKEGRKLQV
jgi:hypothetical protein